MRMHSHKWSWSAASITLLIAGSTLNAQLHIITGEPTPKNPDASVETNLLKIDSDGNLEMVEQLATKEKGLWWIDSADDRRTIALLTSEPELSVVVIGMDQGRVVKRCEKWPDVPGYLSAELWATQYWLVDDQVGGLYVGRYGSRGDPDSVLQGVSLDAATECDGSFRMLEPNDVAEVYDQGGGGISFLTGIVGPTFRTDDSGAVYTYIGGGRIYLGYAAPRKYWADMEIPLGWVWANNSELAVMSFEDKGNPAVRRNIAYDKVHQVWRELPWSEAPLVRAFGSTVAISERVRHSGEAAKQPVSRETPPSQASARRARFDAQRQQAGLFYPGRLHVYDVATGQHSVIVTNEEDSEVLLVDGDTVYYRVNNQIYETSLEQTGLLLGRLIATDERILNAHWAFIK